MSCFIRLISLSLLLTYGAVSAETRDFDIRCCVEESLLNDLFYIKLGSPDHDAVAELQIKTPEGQRIGADDSLLTYYPPVEQGLYALTRLPDKPINSPDWDFTRVAILFRRFSGYGHLHQALDRQLLQGYDYQLQQGQYTATVIGKADGRYVLTVCPYGYGRDCFSGVADKIAMAIQMGERHVYRFDGRVLEAMESKIHHYSITAFQSAWERVE